MRKYTPFQWSIQKTFGKYFKSFVQGKTFRGNSLVCQHVFTRRFGFISAVSMVNNTGHDDSGIHSDTSDMYKVKFAAQAVTKFPSIIEENEIAYKRIRWCSPKYANLDNAEIDVKESEIESFQIVK